MKNKLWIIVLVGISFTGCYTSFAPRDYEEETYGNLEDAYYDSDEYDSDYDTLDYYDEEYMYENRQDITIINNYPSEWGWDYYSPVYVTGRYNYWGAYYSPFYDPYYDPYYRPYYSSYIYWDSYYGPYYSNNYYPSDTRYRNKSHWTSLRNSGGRTSVTRGRDVRNDSQAGLSKRNDDFRDVRGFDLDRELRTTHSSGSSAGSSSGSSAVSTTRNAALKTAVISKEGETKTVKKKTTDLERRRISTKTIDGELFKAKVESRNSKTQNIEKRKTTLKKDYSTSSSSQNRSKRVYSSKRTTGNANYSMLCE